MHLQGNKGKEHRIADCEPELRPAVKLSVAMITYNHERFIREALESVLAQRVDFNYEIVVGEDCSTDRTKAILMELYHRYPERIVPLLHSQNIGLARNFQATLALCRGQYLAIVEGDDYWTCKDKLQKQVNFLEDHPDYSICCHRALVRDETGSGQGGTLFPSARFKPGAYCVEDLIAENFIGTCTVMYRWGLIGTLPDWFLGLKLGDWPLHILIAHSGKIMLMDDVMAVYRVHAAGSWSSKPRFDQIESEIHMLNAVDRHLKFKKTQAISGPLKTRYFELAIMNRLDGNRKAAIKNVIACLRHGKLRLPGRFIDWAALFGYGIFGVRRFRWWRH